MLPAHRCPSDPLHIKTHAPSTPRDHYPVLVSGPSIWHHYMSLLVCCRLCILQHTLLENGGLPVPFTTGPLSPRAVPNQYFRMNELVPRCTIIARPEIDLLKPQPPGKCVCKDAGLAMPPRGFCACPDQSRGAPAPRAGPAATQQKTQRFVGSRFSTEHQTLASTPQNHFPFLGTLPTGSSRRQPH